MDNLLSHHNTMHTLSLHRSLLIQTQPCRLKVATLNIRTPPTVHPRLSVMGHPHHPLRLLPRPTRVAYVGLHLRAPTIASVIMKASIRRSNTFASTVGRVTRE